MPFTALVTVAAVVLTFVLSLRVGAMRQKHGVKAPATTGHPEFERANRVHQNTVEQLVLFLPLLWLALYVLGDAVDQLLPIRYQTHRLGGSHAQRDIIDWTLTEAALRGGQKDLAQAMAHERLALKPHSPVNRQFLARSAAN